MGNQGSDNPKSDLPEATQWISNKIKICTTKSNATSTWWLRISDTLLQINVFISENQQNNMSKPCIQTVLEPTNNLLMKLLLLHFSFGISAMEPIGIKKDRWINGWGYELTVSLFPKSVCQSPNSQCHYISDKVFSEALKVKWGYKGGALIWQNLDPSKWNGKGQAKMQQEDNFYNSRRVTLLGAKLAGTLILDF